MLFCQLIDKKPKIPFGTKAIKPYFCTPKTGLSYGVTVALQILVLSVKVRILIAQQPRRNAGFLFCTRSAD